MAKILIVDDEKNIRKMVSLTLERAGHSVEAAEAGGRGLELFGQGQGWDLVLTDQRMPGLQGRELSYEVRRRDPMARLIMMTSFATLELASDVMRAGATDFLRKPFSADMLRGAVEAALARPRQPSLDSVAEEVDRKAKAVSSGLPKRPAAMPPVSFYYNGFTFWPVAPSPAESLQAHSMEIHRVFQIRGPRQESARCIVGLTPHVLQIVRAETNTRNGDNEFLWEMVCRESLTKCLWEKAEMPPSLLPIYELTSNQLEDIHRLAEPDDGF